MAVDELFSMQLHLFGETFLLKMQVYNRCSTENIKELFILPDMYVSVLQQLHRDHYQTRLNYPSFSLKRTTTVKYIAKLLQWGFTLKLHSLTLPQTKSMLSWYWYYWMRLSRIWRILQIKEGVIHLGLRPLWITPSEICRILNILGKPNSIIALLFIQNIFSFLKEFRHFAVCFSAHQK